MAARMPRYFFHVHDGEDIRDDEGTELGGLAEARQAAVRYAGQLLSDTNSDFWDGTDWKMDVTDESGLVLFSLHFLGIDAPSTQGR